MGVYSQCRFGVIVTDSLHYGFQRHTHSRKHAYMSVTENMGGNMLSWNIYRTQLFVNVLQIVGHTRVSGENIAPVLVLATKAVPPATPLFLSFVVQ